MRNQVFKKLFSVLLALIMVAGLLPASVLAEGEGNAETTPAPTETVQPTESAEPTDPAETETPEVTEVPESTPENPATTVEPTQGEPTAEPTDEGIMPANVMPVQANVAARNTSGDPFYRIVHLDCGRKYFTKDWIIALINEMAEAGYNQLQLAFGNGGFRFYLDNMAVGSYTHEQVMEALEAGNNHYNTYGDGEDGPTNSEWIEYNPSVNALTETEMDAIIKHAQSKGIEVVPMLNTPGHMHAVLAAMSELGITGTLQVSKGCLNLDNEDAVSFTKELVKKYIEYFSSKENCNFFNLAMDEYSSFNDTFFSYANELIGYVSGAVMTPRVFNDALSKGKFTSGTQICYWYSQDTSASSIANMGYSVINTNHDYYYVSTNEYWNLYREGYTFVGNYDESEWVKKAKQFNNTTFYNGTYNNPVGSMFCIWCNTPGKNDETQIAQQIRMILRVIGARMQNSDTYSASNELVEGGFKADGTINVPTNNKTVGNDNDTVRVTGPNLAALTAPEHTGEIVGIKAVDDRIKAYDVTPSTADNNKYIGEAKVRIKIPAEWDSSKVIAFIVESDGTVKDITGKAEDGWYVFDVQHFSVMGIYEKAVEYLDGGTHDVPKGGELKLDRIEGKNLAGEYHTADSSIATVEVTGEDEKTGSGFEYIQKDVNYPAYCTSSNWTKLEGYYYYNNYSSTPYEVYVRKYTDRWNRTYYQCAYNRSGYMNTIGSTQDGDATAILYERVSNTQPAYTDITFKGHEIGTTTVVIDGKKYTINVIDPVLAQQVLPINLWITNTGVVPTGWSNSTPAEFTYSDTAGNRRSIYTLKASHSTVNSPNGISLSSILPQVTGTAKSWDNNTYNVTYWKSAYHTAENRQSTDGWTNYSHKGTKFEYIRFYEGSWAYSVDGITWVNIKNVGAESTDTDKNQVCIWYRQVTTVTSEVTTEIVDWGPIDYKANQCLLDFAVKYDGTADRIPNKFPVAGKTIGFDIAPNDNETYYGTDNGDIYRTVYGIAGVETSNYEVYMITLTPSSDSHTTYINSGSTQTSYTYGGTEKIAWAKTEADANSTELNKMPNVKYGGEPFLESVKIYQYQGLLVTYYLRAKQTPDSLTVHYAIQGSETAFYEYNIAVDRGTTFDSGIALDHSQDPYVGGPLLNGRVTNSNGETITVSSNLATLQGLEPQYRYSKYEIVGFRKDDKNVWIYYTFTREHTYVIDFGLPLNIKFRDFGVEDTSDIKTVSFVENEIVTEKTGTHGTAKVITSEGSGERYVRYTLDKPLGQNITIPLYVTFTSGTKTLFTANIIPATNVYYEDSFAKFYGSDGREQTGFNQTSANDVAGTWYVAKDTSAENNANATQALEALGTKENVYGYDPAYNNCTMFSMGSARKVTVTSDMATNWTDASAWPTAQFTFKGTGFDIISLTDNTSGAIFVDVYAGKEAKGTMVKSYIVDNYYGYTQDESGNWVVDKAAKDNAIYQIPVMQVRNLTYGEYTAVVTVFYDKAFNHTAKNEYNFWLDAVRVYDPAGTDLDNEYVKDKEGFPQYIKLRDELAKTENTTVNVKSMVFIDGGNTANIATYANIGPNNEVYLAQGQAITFKLAGNDLSKIATVQIGAKSPNSNETNKASMVIGNAVKELGTATEMYYDITDAAKNGNAITITNNGNAILSLTNLKITFASKPDAEVTLAKLSEAEQNEAVVTVRALFAPAPIEPEPEPEPEKTFEPERFEASWSRNVIQGRKATLTVKTSEDVEAITVDGQTIRSYRTRTERVGFGRRAKRITYREFTYSMVAQESADFSVTAINAEGTESEAITARLTVQKRPSSVRDVWNWFKGWF